MSDNYFHGDEANLFTFFRIPYVLVTDERYDVISTEAKLLYGLLLDRMSLSAKNGWKDEKGRVFIIYTIEEAMTTLRCSKKTAVKLFVDLENKAHLIERKKHGLGKPATIYVKPFIDTDVHVKRCKNYTPRSVKNTPLEGEILHPNHTDSTQIDITHTITTTSDERPDFDTVEVYATSNLEHMSPGNMEQLASYTEDLPDDVIRYAIDCACGNGIRKWSYVSRILQNWLNEGVRTLGDAKSRTEAWNKGKEEKKGSGGDPPWVF